METLYKDEKIKLLQIKKAKIALGIDLENGLITENEILNLFNYDHNYSITNQKTFDYKKSILKQIYNCPFLLCDQEKLSFKVKTELISFLKNRYEMELNELDKLLELEYLSYDEYLYEKKMLKFCYYKSSEDGEKNLNKEYNKKLKKSLSVNK